jgi:hypothetical protein
MVHGLRDDVNERGAWVQVLQLIRGDDLTHRPTGYEEVFGALFRQWHAALAAEAAVLAGHSDADAMIAHAIAATEHNPIARALARRARTLQGGTSEEFESIAAELDSLGCAYQSTRTLSLAGGSTADQGAARLRSLGATHNRER